MADGSGDLPRWLPEPDIAGEAVAAAREGVVLLQGVRSVPVRRRGGGIDWRDRGPRGDAEYAYFLNRHTHLLALRAAGRAEEAAVQLADWIAAVPRSRMPHEDLMHAGWKPMACATRLLQVWPHIYWGSDGVAPADVALRAVMDRSIAEQVRHLRRHHRRAHNHTIKELAALAFASLAWPDVPGSAERRDYALAGLMRELWRQFTPDGVHVELSCHYHRSALDYYRMVLSFCAAWQVQLPDGFAARVEAAHDYLAHAIDPTGHGLLNNNGDRDPLAAPLIEAAALFGRDDWRFAASGGRDGTPPAHGSDWREWAGQALLRDGWDAEARFAFFDAGPWGAAHQHDDKLNITLVAHGRQLLADGGRYRYVARDPMVRHLRGSAGHNVLLIDGCGQRPGPKRGQGPAAASVALGGGRDRVAASFLDGFRALKGRGRHDRAVMLVHGWGLIVVDRVTSDRPRRLTALWRLGPELDAVIEGCEVASVGAGQGHVRIVPLAAPDWSVDLVRGRGGAHPLGWYSPRYNAIEPATVALFSAEVGHEALFGWAFPTARDPFGPQRIGVERLPAGLAVTLPDGRRCVVELDVPAQ